MFKLFLQISLILISISETLSILYNNDIFNDKKQEIPPEITEFINNPSDLVSNFNQVLYFRMTYEENRMINLESIFPDYQHFFLYSLNCKQSKFLHSASVQTSQLQKTTFLTKQIDAIITQISMFPSANTYTYLGIILLETGKILGIQEQFPVNEELLIELSLNTIYLENLNYDCSSYFVITKNIALFTCFNNINFNFYIRIVYINIAESGQLYSDGEVYLPLLSDKNNLNNNNFNQQKNKQENDINIINTHQNKQINDKNFTYDDKLNQQLAECLQSLMTSNQQFLFIYCQSENSDQIYVWSWKNLEFKDQVNLVFEKSIQLQIEEDGEQFEILNIIQMEIYAPYLIILDVKHGLFFYNFGYENNEFYYKLKKQFKPRESTHFQQFQIYSGDYEQQWQKSPFLIYLLSKEFLYCISQYSIVNKNSIEQIQFQINMNEVFYKSDTFEGTALQFQKLTVDEGYLYFQFKAINLQGHHKYMIVIERNVYPPKIYLQLKQDINTYFSYYENPDLFYAYQKPKIVIFDYKEEQYIEDYKQRTKNKEVQYLEAENDGEYFTGTEIQFSNIPSYLLELVANSKEKIEESQKNLSYNNCDDITCPLIIFMFTQDFYNSSSINQQIKNIVASQINIDISALNNPTIGAYEPKFKQEKYNTASKIELTQYICGPALTLESNLLNNYNQTNPSLDNFIDQFSSIQLDQVDFNIYNLIKIIQQRSNIIVVCQNKQQFSNIYILYFVIDVVYSIQYTYESNLDIPFINQYIQDAFYSDDYSSLILQPKNSRNILYRIQGQDNFNSVMIDLVEIQDGNLSDNLIQVTDGSVLIYYKNGELCKIMPFDYILMKVIPKCIQFDDYYKLTFIDYNLIQNNFIFGQDGENINIYYLDYNFNKKVLLEYYYDTSALGLNKDSTYTFRLILNDYLIKLILINYDNNTIQEFYMNQVTILNPSRQFTLFDQKLKKTQNDQYPIFVINNLLLIQVDDGNDSFYVYSVIDQSINNLIKIINDGEDYDIIYISNKLYINSQNFCLYDKNKKTIFINNDPNLVLKLQSQFKSPQKSFYIEISAQSQYQKQQYFTSLANLTIDFDSRNTFIDLVNYSQSQDQFQFEKSNLSFDKKNVEEYYLSVETFDIFSGPVVKYSLIGDSKDYFDLYQYIKLYARNKIYNINEVILFTSSLQQFILVTGIKSFYLLETSNLFTNDDKYLDGEAIEYLVKVPFYELGITACNQTFTNILFTSLQNTQYGIILQSYEQQLLPDGEEIYTEKLYRVVHNEVQGIPDDAAERWKTSFLEKQELKFYKQVDGEQEIETFEIRPKDVDQVQQIQFKNQNYLFIVQNNDYLIDFEQKNQVLYFLKIIDEVEPQDNLINKDKQEKKITKCLILSKMLAANLNEHWLTIKNLQVKAYQNPLDITNLYKIQFIAIYNDNYQTLFCQLFIYNTKNLSVKQDEVQQYNIIKNNQLLYQNQDVDIDKEIILTSQISLSSEYFMVQILTTYFAFEIVIDAKVQIIETSIFLDYSGCKNIEYTGQYFYKDDFMAVPCKGYSFEDLNLNKEQQLEESQNVKLYLQQKHDPYNSNIQTMIQGISLDKNQLISQFFYYNNYEVERFGILLIDKSDKAVSKLIVQDYLVNRQMYIVRKENCPQKKIQAQLSASNHYALDITYTIKIDAQLEVSWNLFICLILVPFLFSVLFIIFYCVYLDKFRQKRTQNYIKYRNQIQLQQQQKERELKQKMDSRKAQRQSYYNQRFDINNSSEFLKQDNASKYIKLNDSSEQE